MDVAEAIVQMRGFNAFSYADIAPVIGVTKASIHHHFPTKSDLGLQLIQRFSEKAVEALNDIAHAHTSDLIKLREYARQYEETLKDNKMCLCGILAAEQETLSENMQHAVNRFFDGHKRWIEQVLVAGKESGELDYAGDAGTHAQMILSCLQGAVLVARSQRSLKEITNVAAYLVEIYRSK